LLKCFTNQNSFPSWSYGPLGTPRAEHVTVCDAIRIHSSRRDLVRTMRARQLATDTRRHLHEKPAVQLPGSLRFQTNPCCRPLPPFFPFRTCVRWSASVVPSERPASLQRLHFAWYPPSQGRCSALLCCLPACARPALISSSQSSSFNQHRCRHARASPSSFDHACCHSAPQPFGLGARLKPSRYVCAATDLEIDQLRQPPTPSIYSIAITKQA